MITNRRLLNYRILRGQAYGLDPCPAIHKIAVQNYGSSSTLPESLLRRWYQKNPSIFRIAMTSENALAGYLSSLPLYGHMFDQTTDPDFQESSITADDINNSLFPAEGGIFISSIAVDRNYQKQSPTSLLLRLALIEDLIALWHADKQVVHISAQALSSKGEACMKSLGMRERGFTNNGWIIFYGRLKKIDLHSVHHELRQKLETRFKSAD